MSVSTKLHKKTMARFGGDGGKMPGSINDCFRPPLGASKADLAEFHAEDLRLRRNKQRALTSGFYWAPTRKNDDEAWRNREFRR